MVGGGGGGGRWRAAVLTPHSAQMSQNRMDGAHTAAAHQSPSARARTRLVRNPDDGRKLWLLHRGQETQMRDGRMDGPSRAEEQRE